jgi:hypothetical protein
MNMRPGQDVSPEDIFNMFFNGMAGGGVGGPGFHVYSTGFGGGPNMQFRPGRRPQQQRRQGQGQPQQQQAPGWNLVVQLVPILIIALLSFFSQSDGSGAAHRPMPGENKYFSLLVRLVRGFESQIDSYLPYLTYFHSLFHSLVEQTSLYQSTSHETNDGQGHPLLRHGSISTNI